MRGHSYLRPKGLGDFLLASVSNVPIVYPLDLREKRTSLVVIGANSPRIYNKLH